MTKKKLGDLVGVSTRAITSYESGDMQPSSETLRRLAATLQFPIAFFERDEDLVAPPADQVSFRALSRITASQRDAAIHASVIAVELFQWFEKRFTLPDAVVPDFREADPAGAAAAVRAEWDIGARPIGNFVHLLESKGVIVFSLAEDCVEVDAFSLWSSERPFVFLNTKKSSERSRYDAAHELGHLVLHRHAGNTRKVEEEANRFASAFLMPQDSVIAHARRNPTLRTIVEDKTRWGVSAMAYVRRLHEVDLLSEWHYRQLCKQMAKHGFRRKEPNPIPRETSLLLRKVFAQLRDDGLGRRHVAAELAILPEELKVLVFGLVPTAIPGGGAASPRPGDVPPLRLVERSEAGQNPAGRGDV